MGTGEAHHGARPSRRGLLIASAAVVPLSLAAATGATATGYGSGALGSWRHLSRTVSTAAEIRQVLATDGLFMFGDSIAMQDRHSLRRRLLDRTGDHIAVHHWSGRPTAPAVDALARWSLRHGLPRRIIMATGANDVMAPSAFAEQIDRVMSIVGGDRLVYWVNTQVARTGQSATVQLADQRNSAWVNLQLADAQRRFPQLRIVRWAEFLAAEPHRLTTYLRDGVHTTEPLGQDARNELIVRAVEAARRSPAHARTCRHPICHR